MSKSSSHHNPLKVFVNDSYSKPKINAETIKKAVAIARAIEQSADLRRVLELNDPASSPEALHEAIAALESFVDPAYLAAIRSGNPRGLAASNGLGWDPDLYDMVVNSTAGILSALRQVQGGDFVAASLSSGLHHASPASGNGFCTVNSLAVVALIAARQGLKVAILDLDAHCGGGTEAFLRKFPDLAEHISHIDISLSPFDRYEPRRSGSCLEIAEADTYLESVRDALNTLSKMGPEIVLYNAGVDIWPRVAPEVVASRDRMVVNAIKNVSARCVIVLAGGYGADEEIIPLHVGTLTTFAGVQKREHEMQLALERLASQFSCSHCGSKLVPVMYGYPVGEAIWEQVTRGEVVLGGCMRSPGADPLSICLNCGREQFE